MSFDLKPCLQPQATFSPQHKKLNQLLIQIEAQKAALLKWQLAQDNIQQQIRLKLLPIYADLHQIWLKQLEQLWANVQNDEFSKAEQQQLDEKTAQLAEKLTKSQFLQTDQQALMEHISSFYRQLQQDKSKVKAQKISLSESKTEHIEEAEFDTFEDWDSEIYQQQREDAKRKRQQEKREQAEKLAEQSLKTVYLKITAMIHPDREPDESKKAEKTELLQVVNQAHEKQDLFYLLKLQLQLENNKGLNAKELSKEQLKLYKLALEGQSQNLDSQITKIIDSFYISTPVRCEADVYKAIDADVVSLKQTVKWEKERLKYFGKVQDLKMLMENEVF